MAIAPQVRTKAVTRKRLIKNVQEKPETKMPEPVRHRTVRLKDKSQVTIPYRIRRQLSLQEGDHFEVTVEDGKIVLEPVAVLDARWRRMIEEAEEDYREGRVTRYPSIREGLEALRHELGLD